MKAGIVNRKIVLLMFSLITTIFILCTTTPTGPGEGKYEITISLVEEGVTETVYDGTDLNMIVKFKDSVECSFDIIKIHSSDAQFYLPDESITGQMLDSVVIPLYWISTANLLVDSSDTTPFDTVYVQVGLDKSNVVKININNLSPVIDSLCAGDTSYTVFNRIQELNVFNYYISDTLQNSDIALRVIARDIDSPKFNVTWENEDDDKYLVWNQSTQNIAIYKARQGNFRDRVNVVIYDTDANIEVKVNVIQLDGSEILIDSITYKDGINNTTFTDTAASHYSITAIAFNNTAAVRAYPRSTEGSATWSAVNGLITINTAIDTNGFAITYVCTLSNLADTLMTDMISFVDSIRLVHKNKHEDDSLTKTIVLYKKPANRKPVIDSMLISTDIRKNNYKDTIAAGSTIPLKAYATDPEGGGVTFTWQGELTGSLYSATGDSNSYTAALTAYSDTITLIASDSLGFKDTQTIILLNNVLPVIDSILIDTTMYYSGFQHIVHAESLVIIRAYAHDPEGGVTGGTVTYRWQWQGTANGIISSTIVNPIFYTAGTGVYRDELYVLAYDSLGFADIRLLTITCNNPPTIDSIRVKDTLFVPVSQANLIFNYSINAPDTFAVEVYAQEMDTTLNDAVVSYLWEYLDGNLNNATSVSTAFTYMSADSAYVDNVTLTVKDKFNLASKPKINITFK